MSSSSFRISDLIDKFLFNFYFSLGLLGTFFTTLEKSLFLSSSIFTIESRFCGATLYCNPNKKLD
jgi:uncharacterized membrane protein